MGEGFLDFSKNGCQMDATELIPREVEESPNQSLPKFLT